MFALIVNPIKRTCSFVMWAPHTLNHGHATHFHNYKSPHTLTFAQTAQTPKTTLNNLQLKTHSWHCCVYTWVCVCVCAAPTMSVCFSLNGFLWRRQGRGEKWVRERDRDEKNEENSGNSLQQDKYPQLGVTRPPHSLLLHTHTHTHADYRVNMCNLINQPLFGRRKKQTHIHNMQTQTCWLWRKWTCEVISQVRSHTRVLMA